MSKFEDSGGVEVRVNTERLAEHVRYLYPPVNWWGDPPGFRYTCQVCGRMFLPVSDPNTDGRYVLDIYMYGTRWMCRECFERHGEPPPAPEPPDDPGPLTVTIKVT